MYREQAAVDRGDCAKAEAQLGHSDKLRCADDATNLLADPITIALSESLDRSIDAGRDPAILPRELPSVLLWLDKYSNLNYAHSCCCIYMCVVGAVMSDIVADLLLVRLC